MTTHRVATRYEKLIADKYTYFLTEKEQEQDDSSIAEAEAYSNFDKLWLASRHHLPVLESQWNCIRERIEKQGPEVTRYLLSAADVSIMLALCEMKKVNIYTRLRALELYSRYLQLIFAKPEEFKYNGKSSSDYFSHGRISKRFLRLHMCACIQIASKLHEYVQVKHWQAWEIRMTYAQGYLPFQYNLNNLAQTEMHILKTLGFKCHWITPLDLVEQLLTVLGLELEFARKVRCFCLYILEYFYHDIQEIRRVFSEYLEKAKLPDCQITLHLEAAAVVDASLFTASPQTTSIRKSVASKVNLGEEVYVLSNVLVGLLGIHPDVVEDALNDGKIS